MNFLSPQSILPNLPNFRYQQIINWIWCGLLTDWSGAKNLPQDLRAQLSQILPLTINAKVLTSADKKTAKALITLGDGSAIETVLMKHSDGRRTACLSSQVGCPMGCVFCSTGTMGLKRNLTAEEILLQALLWQRELAKVGEKLSNAVFMGMGEPLLNYAAVMEAIKILHEPKIFNIGSHHISISTCGILPAMKKLGQERIKVNLALSLHAPDDKLRTQLMPVNKTYRLKPVLAEALKYYKLTGRQVMLEYVLIKNVNDAPEQAHHLADLIKDLDQTAFIVNLIPYNDTKIFKSSTGEAIKKFKEIVSRAGIKTVQRYRFGANIKAACGQLASRKS